MAVSGKPDAVIFIHLSQKEIIMAAGTAVAKIVCILGLSAAVVILLLSVMGFLVWIYGIRYFEKLEEER